MIRRFMGAITHKKSIIKKMLGISGLTIVSRFLGIIREFLMVRYLGAGAISDAFISAYRVPNSLRKIFAEGALSAAFIPTLVSVLRGEGEKKVSSLVTAAFLVFEGIVLVLCCLVMWRADALIYFLAPGFDIMQAHQAITLIRILMPFIFFLSSSSLIAGALQAVHHFFVPAFSPVLLNIVFIIGLIVCIFYNFPVEYLCFFILFGGFLQFVLHVIAYFKLHFSFSKINKKVWIAFAPVFIKFLLCLPSMSIMEINLIIDGRFASYLTHGSISLLYYANRFMGIPLGVFAVALSTVLLPFFSRVGSYAPKRLSFYLLETAKLVFWVMFPVMIVMGFFSKKIFYTIFLSDKFSLAQVTDAGMILLIFLGGLFFFAFNKILLNFYYALHNTWLPALVAFVAALVNWCLDFFLVSYFQAFGLALATVLSGIIQTLLFIFFLYKYYNFGLYVKEFLKFLFRYMIQLCIVLVPMFFFYYGGVILINLLCAPSVAHFFLLRLGFWLWVGPLCVVTGVILFVTRRRFGLKLYFLD